MNVEKLFPKETNVKISIVKIDNKKLTKGIFNQLNRISPFDRYYNLKEKAKLFGYVNDKGKWIIWSDNEFICKYEMKEIYPFLRINIDRDKIEDLIKVYDSEEVKSLYRHSETDENGNHCGNIYRDVQISSVLSKKEQYEIISKKELIEKIFAEILERQIFL